MKRCVILSAGPVADAAALSALLQPEDYVIAADGGLMLAKRLGVTPHVVVADFDSGSTVDVPTDAEVVRLPVQKDVTDTAAAAALAVERGYREIWILGGTGGRLDHQYANMLTLVSLSRQGVHAVLADERNRIEVAVDSPVTILPEQGWHLSLFAFGAPVSGLCIDHALYTLDDYRLQPHDPLCVSNAVGEEPCTIRFREGVLLIFRSRD